MFSNKSNIFTYIFYDIYKQPPIILWHVINILFSILLFFTELKIDSRGFNLLIFFNKLEIPVHSDGKIWLTYFAWIIVALCFLVFPKHFIDTIDKKRISLIISKSISRNAFIFQELLSVYLVTAYCTLFNLFLILSILINFGVVSCSLIYLSILIPLIVTVIYIVIMYLSAYTNSFGLTILLLFLHLMIFSPFLENREYYLSQIQPSLWIKYIIDVIYYSLPQFNNLLSYSILPHKIDMDYFVSFSRTILSFIPVGLLLINLINKRNF